MEDKLSAEAKDAAKAAGQQMKPHVTKAEEVKEADSSGGYNGNASPNSYSPDVPNRQKERGKEKGRSL